MPRPRYRRLRESKPATSANHFLERNTTPPWLPKKSSYALDAVPKPYYCRISIQTPEPSYHDGSCLALHRRTLPVHVLPTTEKASALASLMTRVSQTVM